MNTVTLATHDDVTTIEFENVRKDDRVYSVRFREKALIQTKPTSNALCSALVSEDGEPMPFVHVNLDAESETLLRTFEKWVLASTKENKLDWFKKDIDDAYLDTSFKSYFKNTTNHFVLKVAEDVAAFTPQGDPLSLSDIAPDATVVLLLEASQITFGKTEFGCLWKLKQMMVLPPKPPKKACLIQFIPDEDEDQDDIQSKDGEYFL